MRRHALVALITALTATMVFAAGNSRKIGTINFDGWESLVLTGSTVVASGGKPEIKSTDGNLYARADKMVVELNKAPKGQKSAGGTRAIKNAELTGNVTFSVKPEPGRFIKGSGARLNVIGAEQKAVLDGGGKIVEVEVMDPQVFDQPSTVKGEVILVNLKSNPAPDEWRIKVQSSPEKSHISVTPKPKSEGK